MHGMKRLPLLLVLVLTGIINSYSQTAAESHQKIRAALERREYLIVIADLENLAKSERKIFELNSYDYLLARMTEKTGDFARAMANYQRVVKRGSVLKEYALWRLSQIARSSGNLMLERLDLNELIAFAPNSILQTAARNRLIRSWFEGGSYDEAIRLLNDAVPPRPADLKSAENRLYRDNQTLLARAYLYSGNADKARTVFTE